MAGIRLENLYKVYESSKVEAVKGVNLTIRDQEFLVLVGPSGCGKTTLLRMIAGLEKITAGNIYIEDRLVNRLHPRRRNLAMVFQDYALYPHMTVFENLSFGLRNEKVPKDVIREKVGRTARMLGIDKVLDRKPRELSGGQRQRVALGRATVREPDAFLLDEPLSNLDAKLRADMRVELKELHQSLQTTMIYVTHDQVEAMTLGERIVVMNEGEIQQVASPSELYGRPTNLFVAAFIGTPPMNLVDGTIVSEGGLKFETALPRVGAFSVEIPSRLKEPLSAYADRAVVMGIRCEDIEEAGTGSNAHTDGAVTFPVGVVENLGSHCLLHVGEKGSYLIARVGPDTKVRLKERVALRFNMDKAHFFDKESGERIE